MMFERIYWISDCVLLLAISSLFWNICYTRKCSGISAKTQYLYALIFVTRFCSLALSSVPLLSLFFAFTCIIMTFAILIFIAIYSKKTHHQKYDRARLHILVIPCVVLTCLINYDSYKIEELLKVFSIYLEAVAMIPQFQFVIAAKRIKWNIVIYTITMATYNFLKISNWAYQHYCSGEYDRLQVAAGVVQMFLYFDFFIQLVHWLCTAKDDERQITIATIEAGVDNGLPKTSHFANNLSAVVLRAPSGSTSQAQREMVNLIAAEKLEEVC